LIKNGRVFVAVPPLYRIDIGNETHWAADEIARARIVATHGQGNKKVDVTRFKGLGEMMPKVLWQTTLDPRKRRLLQVQIHDGLETDRVVNDLMGKDASARFRFIMDGAEGAEGLDV
jgi:DNA gyrase subunit B/topoisomerase-4 subunit B